MALKTELDWKNLGFAFLPTNGIAVAKFQKGEWSELEFTSDCTMNLHAAANVLHYGQACFEGLKAFRTREDKVVLFRPDRNAARMRSSAERLCMQAPSERLFMQACRQAVAMNLEFVPPYGTGASLYVRPFLIGTTPTVGLRPSEDYLFAVLVTPVGPYYKDGFHPVEAIVIEDYDRAAPLGTGAAKVAGNYAAGLKPGIEGAKRGYPIVLFTDPKEHRFVDEFGTSNFFGITGDGVYKTPESESILQSITNESLQDMAQDMDLRVSREPIAMDSLDQFVEVGACGTAAVITPIQAIHWRGKTLSYGEKGKAGKVLTELFRRLKGIQYGEIEDRHGWLEEVSRNDAD